MTPDALVAPWSPAAFLAEVRERRPVVLPRRGGPFGVGLDDLDALLADRTLVFPCARVLGPQGTVAPGAYAHASLAWGPGALPGVLRPEAMVDHLRRGASLAFDRVDRQLAGARDLRLGVARWLAAETSVNAYLSPAGGQGFPPHWDTQDVFVLQVAGTKRWWVHAPTRPLPRRTEACPAGGVAPGPLVLEVELAPGDALYLPRGFVHHARAGAAASLHLSVSVTPLTVADLREACGALVPADPVARGALPAAWDPGLDALDPAARALLGDLEPARVRGAWEGLLDRVVQDSPGAPTGWLRHVAAPAPPGPGQRIVPMPQLCRVRPRAGSVVVVVPGRTLVFPAFAARALAALLGAGAPVVAGALPGLSEDEALELVGHLLDAGVVRLLPAA